MAQRQQPAAQGDDGGPYGEGGLNGQVGRDSLILVGKALQSPRIVRRSAPQGRPASQHARPLQAAQGCLVLLLLQNALVKRRRAPVISCRDVLLCLGQPRVDAAGAVSQEAEAILQLAQARVVGCQGRSLVKQAGGLVGIGPPWQQVQFGFVQQGVEPPRIICRR